MPRNCEVAVACAEVILEHFKSDSSIDRAVVEEAKKEIAQEAEQMGTSLDFSAAYRIWTNINGYLARQAAAHAQGTHIGEKNDA